MSGSNKKGIRSHGAYALSKVLIGSQFIEEVYLTNNRIGPYGSSAIFYAAKCNPNLKTLLMRGCRIGERGAMVFAKEVLREGSSVSGLEEVDLSANRIGFTACFEIEKVLKERMTEEGGASLPVIDLEGNMVFQEVSICVTRGRDLFVSPSN